MRSALILIAALACLLVSAPPAIASYVSVSRDRLTITGAPGEVNDLLITSGEHDDDPYIRVRESGPGAGISNGSGCVLYAGDVYCGSAHRITVNAGDGNDKVVNQTSLESKLTGGRGDDQLYGGGGDDTVEGQDDADTLSGGFGDDDLKGGPGSDTVTFAYAWYGIVADPDDYADDGAFGGHDNVRKDVENLVGGRGSDRLYGNAGANSLTGGEGDDQLFGAEGNDMLTGGPGEDALRGEAGDDWLNSLDGVGDSSSCGEGNDSLIADPSDETTGDCESVSYGVTPPPPAAPLPVRVTKKVVRVTPRGLARLRLRCTSVARGGCTGTVKLILPRQQRGSSNAKASAQPTRERARQVVLGRARFSVRSGRLATVKVRLSRNGRRRVMRRRRVRCRVSVAVRDAQGVRRTVTGVVTLKAPEVTAP